MSRLQSPVQTGIVACLLVLGSTGRGASQDALPANTLVTANQVVDRLNSERLFFDSPDSPASPVISPNNDDGTVWSYAPSNRSFGDAGDVWDNVILMSIFGKPDPGDWRPLPFSTFLSEGWNEAWVPSPNGSGGAPRQAWINAASANMNRAQYFSFAEGFNHPPHSDAYEASYLLLTPLSRRLLLVTSVPFILVNNAPTGFPTINPQSNSIAGHQSQRTFGDVSITPRFLLHETKDFSLTAEMTVVTPTGSGPLAGNTDLVPNVSFWNNIAGGWVIRGGTGITLPMGGGGNSLINQFAIGQTVTSHDVPLLGDFTYYLSTVVTTPLSSQQTSVVLTPGIRTHLGNSWYFVAGLPTPVTKQRIAELGMIFWVMKGW